MGNRRLFWHLFPAFFLLTALALLAFAWVAAGHVREFHLQQSIAGLRERARLVEALLPDGELASAGPELAALCRRLATVGTRLTIILPDGTVAGESAADAESMENHGSRPEVVAALRGGSGWALRPSKTVRDRLLYVAVPLMRDGHMRGVLRAAVSEAAHERDIAGLYDTLAWVGGVALLLVALASHLMTRYLTDPVRELTEGAAAFGAGRLDTRIPSLRVCEFSELAGCLNRMAGELDSRIRIIERERNEREALFRSMAEGMLAVDMQERILTINKAAEALLGYRAVEAAGRMLVEVVRHPELQAFIGRAIRDGGQEEGTITFHGGDERHFHIRSTELCDFDGTRRGALIALSDMTELYRLERVRRDFVANVSHELRTPITSIRGCAETLLDGDGPGGEDDRRKFLQSILRQTARLEALINDLLDLSRIERKAEERTLAKRTVPVAQLLENVRRGCDSLAVAKRIAVNVACDETLFVEGDEEMLERAMSNLLDNAIKYSGPDTTVEIEALRRDGETVLAVRDHGCGIADHHLPRIFERFYRADKARSREQGGTGLGLSIVKHIAQLHGGTVSVESRFGEGSRFAIMLPPDEAAD